MRAGPYGSGLSVRSTCTGRTMRMDSGSGSKNQVEMTFDMQDSTGHSLPYVERAIQLLRLGITVPPPNDPVHLAELTKVGTKMSGDYGAGKFCPDANNPTNCMDIGKIEDVLKDVPRDWRRGRPGCSSRYSRSVSVHCPRASSSA